MKIQELFEADLDVEFRRTKPNRGRVWITYDDKRINIYVAEVSEHGTTFHPVSPWRGETLYSRDTDPRSAWKDVEEKVKQMVYAAFSNAAPDASHISRKMGLTTR